MFRRLLTFSASILFILTPFRREPRTPLAVSNRLGKSHVPAFSRIVCLQFYTRSLKLFVLSHTNVCGALIFSNVVGGYNF